MIPNPSSTKLGILHPSVKEGLQKRGRNSRKKSCQWVPPQPPLVRNPDGLDRNRLKKAIQGTRGARLSPSLASRTK